MKKVVLFSTVLLFAFSSSAFAEIRHRAKQNVPSDLSVINQGFSSAIASGKYPGVVRGGQGCFFSYDSTTGNISFQMWNVQRMRDGTYLPSDDGLTQMDFNVKSISSDQVVNYANASSNLDFEMDRDFSGTLLSQPYTEQYSFVAHKNAQGQVTDIFARVKEPYTDPFTNPGTMQSVDCAFAQPIPLPSAAARSASAATPAVAAAPLALPPR